MDPQKIALLIIDMQNDVLRFIVPTGASVVPAIQRVLQGCRRKGVHVVHCLRIHRADGIDVEKFRLQEFRNEPFLVRGTEGAKVVHELEPLTGDYQVTKARFSGFFQTDLQMLLTRLAVTSIVVCGVQTPNCVRGTAVDALAYDYDVIVVDDAIAASSPEVHRANILDMEHMGARIMTVDSFLKTLA